MRLIEKIRKSFEEKKAEKELKQEERLILKEIEQERITQRAFDKMLDIEIPCEKIIRLKNADGETHYFQMGGKDIAGISFRNEKEGLINMPSRLRQLTGAGSGDIHDVNPPSGYRSGMYHCEFNGFRIFAIETSHIDNSYKKDNYFQRRYGSTTSLRQLLMKWKTDNRQMMDITMEGDYEMVKRVYDSEKDFTKQQNTSLSK